VIAGRLSGDAAAILCERLVRLLDDGRAPSVVCDLSALDRADLAAVDGLARLQLAAHRRGRRMRLRGSSWEMRRLIALLGLGDVLPLEPISERRRTLGQAEQRKQGGRIEEGGETDHPAV
jgi:anti-anti-sigma regulatory factor